MKVEASSVDLEFLSKCFVGFLSDSTQLQTFCDSLVLGRFGEIRARALGGDMILLSLDDEGLMLHFAGLGEEEWSRRLSKILRWTPELTVHWREVWLRCWGVPVQVWGQEVFIRISGLFGEPVMVDPSTLAAGSFDCGRVRVRLPVASHRVDEVVDIDLGGYVVAIRVLEESGISADKQVMCVES